MLTHEEIDEAAEALARGWSLPYRWMGDPDLTRFENDELFARSWQAIASGVLERGRLMTAREDSVPGVQALILQAYRRAVANGSRQPARQAAAT